MFQVWRRNKITDFIPKLLDFEITVNLTVDFVPNEREKDKERVRVCGGQTQGKETD
jgi:hypothetical protein